MRARVRGSVGESGARLTALREFLAGAFWSLFFLALFAVFMGSK